MRASRVLLVGRSRGLWPLELRSLRSLGATRRVLLRKTLVGGGKGRTAVAAVVQQLLHELLCPQTKQRV